MTVQVNVSRPTVALELSGGRGATGAAGQDLDPHTSHDAAGASRMAAAIYTMAFQGLGLGAMSAQAPSAVSITGGTITGITDLAVVDGGTGASTAAAARTNLGVGTADSPEFAGINVGAAADTTVTRASAGDIAVEGNRIFRVGGADVPVADGGTGASTAAAAATNLGLGTGDSPQFTAVNIGAATDTTVSRASAGDIAVEGNIVYRAGGTDVPITDGGTGASSASAARTNLGLQYAFLDLGSNIYRAQGGGGVGVTNLFQLFNSTSHNSLEIANSTGALAVRLVADGTSARVLVNGSQVVGARGAALPADATDLASVIALANAIKARMKATGGHGLVAD